MHVIRFNDASIRLDDASIILTLVAASIDFDVLSNAFFDVTSTINSSNTGWTGNEPAASQTSLRAQDCRQYKFADNVLWQVCRNHLSAASKSDPC